MTDPAEDTFIAARAARLAQPGAAILPKHLRMIGGYFLFAAAVLIGINVYSWRSGTLWPKALILAPSVLLLGLWMVLDASALAGSRRRQQRVILWSAIIVGTGIGVALLHHLTGRFF